MKRVAIIDDETDARQLMRSFLNTYCPDVDIAGEADSVESAYKLIRQVNPQVILLDISMEDGTGFELLDKFQNPFFQVIFITAHDEFALKAFRYNALDYLLKPVNPEELAKAIDRIGAVPPEDYSSRISNLLENNRKKTFDKIMLTSMEGMIFLRLDQIVRIESDASYTTFYLMNNERHLITRPIIDFEDFLNSEGFFRLHQSHIVNLSYVKKILREDGGYALMEDGEKVPIARRRKDEFLETMKLRFLK
ncbi:MAG: LytTR family DNA-binding domain-containing protein [Bacteroidota bacterium]|nr:LytTR family DNA-binding domain-containing protein [Bacteroidota bacterium]